MVPGTTNSPSLTWEEAIIQILDFLKSHGHPHAESYTLMQLAIFYHSTLEREQNALKTQAIVMASAIQAAVWGEDNALKQLLDK